MNSPRRPSRIGFRARLTLMITAVFIAAGATLVLVQNLIVGQLFDSAIEGSVCLQQVDANGEVMHQCMTGAPGVVPETPIVGSIDDAVQQQSLFLDSTVRGGLLVWSIVVLVVFAAAAAGLAYWLARRALRRIADITTATNEISERDLGRRLALAGPDDEVKELGDTIDRMLERLEDAFLAQDRFVANASHELRTPLTTVRASLEIPLTRGDVPAALEPAIHRALRANAQSERLIAALLVLARGRIGALDVEPVDVAAIVAGEVDDLATAARDRGLRVRIADADGDRFVEGDAFVADGDALVVDGDATLIERAVRNLLDNAIRHNRDDGTVDVRVTSRADAVTVEVANTGRPLTAEAVALLVEPFHRGEESRTADGGSVGLGLAIVSGIADAHGGVLELSPGRPDGLVARLVLPRA